MSERVRDLPQSKIASIGDGPRVANLCKGPQGEVRGAAIFLSSSQLIALGVDFAGNDAVAVQIVDGELQLESRDTHTGNNS